MISLLEEVKERTISLALKIAVIQFMADIRPAELVPVFNRKFTQPIGYTKNTITHF
jgi:hypothetical protein